MKVIYPGIFYREEEQYWMEFPDLEGCQTYGNTLSETIELAEEALGTYLVSKIENGEQVPSPSDIQELDASKGFASYVSIEMDYYRKKTKAIKKTLSIPQWLNEEAEKKHLNFSSILQKALLSELEKR